MILRKMLFDDAYFMQQAFVEAQKAFGKDEIPVGAVIVCQNRIIARAHNLTETLSDVTAHAEMQAITVAANALGGKYLKGCTLYVTLEPCAMCAGAIANARISKLYFGAYEKKGGACGSVHNILENSGLNSNTEVHGGVMENECSTIIKKFFENKRNKIDILS